MELEISDFTGCKIALFCGDKLFCPKIIDFVPKI